jgi:hypothetical protein
MTDCESIQRELALLLYGELSFDQEERVEAHLDACVECRAALQRERSMHAAADAIEITPSPSLLRECREDLFLRLSEEPAPASAGWWDKFVDAIALRPSAGWFRPAGAVTLVALGFAIARIVPMGDLLPRMGTAGFADAGPGHVRYVERAPDGRVQIVLDETRQRIISGSLEEQPIRALLLSAAKDPSDPGLRAETVEILNSRAQAADFRDALIFAVEHDQNAGVRMKAMDGLKQFAHDAAVRTALKYVLLGDTNPGLRTQAIDLLVNANTPSMDREMVGTLQELMERGEQLSYVRERCRRLLDAMNASAETY